MKPNRVNLFSNGMGHFVRHYEVKPGDPVKISLPFNKDHINDVATSLNVFNANDVPVKYAVPPSFTATNAETTNLSINPANALRTLFTKFSGAEVTVTTIDDTHIGQIMGLDTIQTVVDGENVTKDVLSIATEHGWYKKVFLTNITAFRFKKKEVQAEVDKALSKNFQKIKPNSSFVDLTLTTQDENATETAEAAITYTVPVAAWKMRYSIQEENGNFFLEGAVIVDNNTDEDWDDFLISVVTGDPITFKTDIATIKVPNRHMVNLVDINALGNVEVEDAQYSQMLEAAVPAMAAGGRGVRRAKALTRSVANEASFGMEECADSGYNVADMIASEGVEAKDVGDFCVFTSKSAISIASKKSAVVPMFNVPLKKAGVVLLYKEDRHARRPFRAVKFKNETEYTLGKGKVIIYNDGLLAGECVLETAKPGENRMLPHCLENGVKIVKNKTNGGNILTSIKVSDSTAIREDLQWATAEYTVENKKDEPFSIAIETSNQIYDSTVDFEGVKIDEVEKLSNGHRLYFNLQPKQKFTLLVKEKKLNDLQVNIGENFAWIRQNILHTSHDLANNDAIRRCAKLQQELDELNQEQSDLNSQITKLERQAQRIRQNIESAKSSDAALSSWIQDLDKFDKECREIEDIKVPGMTDKIKVKQKELYEALASLSVSWEDTESKPFQVESKVVEPEPVSLHMEEGYDDDEIDMTE